MIDTFRDRLLGELTELIPETPEPAPSVTPTVPRRHRGRRRLVLAAAAATVTALGTTLVLNTVGPNGSPPAWAIERGRDGQVRVTVYEVPDPARLQADLRAAGVPAIVRAGSAGCQTWTERSEPELPDVLRGDVMRSGDDHHWVIDPRALKPGHVLAFLITHTLYTSPPDDRSYIVKASTYSIIVSATENPSCA